ncbi:hypothetical protein PIB30_046855 [Stylosanthes scabra]|uniref:Uncharacterized protein n=1 Tax=Stylosanthes scabra TaxID=79078 RepID=A0ABU6ZFB7_9FABA|nr:hypothetical protein [Stylosanthes scabra]
MGVRSQLFVLHSKRSEAKDYSGETALLGQQNLGTSLYFSLTETLLRFLFGLNALPLDYFFLITKRVSTINLEAINLFNEAAPLPGLPAAGVGASYGELEMLEGVRLEGAPAEEPKVAGEGDGGELTREGEGGDDNGRVRGWRRVQRLPREKHHQRLSRRRCRR